MNRHSHWLCGQDTERQSFSTEACSLLACRALLQDAHVLALDEATANVDQATDALIQQALRIAVKSNSGTSPRRTLLVGIGPNAS